jgi:hypothetical protein
MPAVARPKDLDLSPPVIAVEPATKLARADRGAIQASPSSSISALTIDDPGSALAPFLRALLAREKGGERRVIRVLHFGDSLIDLDLITSTLRRRFQQRFGDGGHGFTPVARPWRWYDQRGVLLSESSGWNHLRLVGERAHDGHLGLGAVAVESQSGRPSVSLRTSEARRFDRLEVYYERRPGGGTLDIRVDGDALAKVDTAGEARAPAVFSLRVRDTPHQVKLQAQGKVRLYGLILERSEGGITWENLPLIGTRFHELIRLSAKDWTTQLEQRQPDLVIFQYGANDTLSFGGSLEQYGKSIAAVLGRVRRALSKSSCLVIGPLDRLQRDLRGGLHSPPIVRSVGRVQRVQAHTAGCAFFDGQRAMGGPGAMKQWLTRGWARKDMVHLSPKGGRAFAMLLDRALSAALERQRLLAPKKDKP